MDVTTQASEASGGGRFPRTHWSLVLAAAKKFSPESSAALESICRAYWQPLFSFARQCGCAEHDAQDLTQEFFAQLLQKNWLDDADPHKGRLRSFLVVAFKNFMRKQHRRDSALKRGGGISPVALETENTPAQAMSPDQVYDQQWALTLLELTLTRLQEEFSAAGKKGDFDILKLSLMAGHGETDYGIVAKQLDVTFGTARVAVHRLRRRFRELYREEISRTVAEDADVDAELRHLAAALACNNAAPPGKYPA